MNQTTQLTQVDPTCSLMDEDEEMVEKLMRLFYLTREDAIYVLTGERQ